MPKVIVRLGTVEDVDEVQSIFNDSRNSEWLGGFTLREPILSKAKAGTLAVAVLEDQTIIGANEVRYSGWHRLIMDLVATRSDYRRVGVGSLLYTYWLGVARLQGKIQLQDHIIGNNPYMPYVLPTLGFEKYVELRSKVRRHHSLNLWVRDVSNVDHEVEHKASERSHFIFDLERAEQYNEMYENAIEIMRKIDPSRTKSLEESRGVALEWAS